LYSRRDLNPHGHYYPLDFKSSVSTNSTTRALLIVRAKNGIRTRDLHLGKVALYQLSYFRILQPLFCFSIADANVAHNLNYTRLS
jgi:hypothetical protein